MARRAPERATAPVPPRVTLPRPLDAHPRPMLSRRSLVLIAPRRTELAELPRTPHPPRFERSAALLAHSQRFFGPGTFHLPRQLAPLGTREPAHPPPRVEAVGNHLLTCCPLRRRLPSIWSSAIRAVRRRCLVPPVAFTFPFASGASARCVVYAVAADFARVPPERLSADRGSTLQKREGLRPSCLWWRRGQRVTRGSGVRRSAGTPATAPRYQTSGSRRLTRFGLPCWSQRSAAEARGRGTRGACPSARARAGKRGPVSMGGSKRGEVRLVR
jgi:hypothetical protein